MYAQYTASHVPAQRPVPHPARPLRRAPPNKPRILSHMPRSRDGIHPALRTLLGELLADRRPWPLYLHGGPGRGKTCAGLCVHDWLDSSAVWYGTLDSIVGEGIAYGRVDPWSWVWRALRRDLVIVDEVGASTTDRDYLALRRAAELREHRRAIWLGNLPPDDLERAYGDRIVSRLCCGTVRELGGPDRRYAR